MRRLDLSHNSELQLALGCFSGLSVLTELLLSGCGMKVVPAAAWSGVGRTLRRLNLNYNSGLQLAPGCFSSLSVLALLKLRGCGPRAVLAELDLSGCGLPAGVAVLSEA